MVLSSKDLNFAKLEYSVVHWIQVLPPRPYKEGAGGARALIEIRHVYILFSHAAIRKLKSLRGAVLLVWVL